jgi:branched-chain amino acid aminotransferase
MPTLKAKKKGFTQILWLYEGRVGEVGTSNIFFVLKGKDGVKELITPELDGLILPGITRDSIIVSNG